MTISAVTTSTASNDSIGNLSFTVGGVEAGDQLIVGLWTTIQPTAPSTTGWYVLGVGATGFTWIYSHTIAAGDISGGNATYTFSGCETPRLAAIAFRSTTGYLVLDSVSQQVSGASTAPPTPGNVACQSTSDWQVEVFSGLAYNSGNSFEVPPGWSGVLCPGDASVFFGVFVAYPGSTVGGFTAYGVAPTASTFQAFFACEGLNLTIREAATPYAPQLVSPTSNSYTDLVANPTFQWSYEAGDGSQQGAFAFRRKIGAGAYQYFNWEAENFSASSPAWNASNSQTWEFPAGLWTDTSTYNWSVACQSSYSSALQGPFATDQTVTGQVAPTISSIEPTGVVTTSTPTVSWTASFPTGLSQVGYQVLVYPQSQAVTPGSTPGWLYNSGYVPSTATAVQISGLPNNTAMNIFVQITETNGVASLWYYSQISTVFAEPSIPTVSVTQSLDSNGIPVLAATVQTYENLLTAVDASMETGVGTWTAGAGTSVAQSGGMATAPSTTPIQICPYYLGTTNPQNNVTPTVTDATTAGHAILAVVSAYNAAGYTFTTTAPAGFTLLGQNATPTTDCQYLGIWLLTDITAVSAGGNYGEWSFAATTGEIVATITYTEWANIGSLDNVVAYLSSATPTTTTGTISVPGTGTAGMPAESTELAVLISCAVLTGGGEPVANTPSGWTAAWTGSSTTSGMHIDVFTQLPGTNEPQTTVTYMASVSGYTLAGLLLKPSGTVGTSVALDGKYSLQLTGI